MRLLVSWCYLNTKIPLMARVVKRNNRHARVLSPYPPHFGGGALGVSGIQTTVQQCMPIKSLDSRQLL
jgi:hypothetical protein